MKDRKNLIDEIRKLNDLIDIDFVMRETEKLTSLEYAQTFVAREKAAEYTKQLLIREGFSSVEKIEFKADGKTAYQDKRMPISWDVTTARLTLLSPVPELENPVIADYERHPFSIVWGSTSTPEGGIVARIVTESDVYKGEDIRGALVLLESSRAAREFLPTILDLGAIGFISDAVVGAETTPDEITWINNAIDDVGHWHVQADDRDFIGFSISARDGKALRAAAHRSQIFARVESDAHRHENGKVNLVTATVPGESERELWMIAHLAEPIATDNSCGVIGAIEIARLIKRMIESGEIKKPKYTLRLIFTMELYGLCAAAEHFGGYLGDRAIGALNLDGMPITYKDDKTMTYLAPASSPCASNYLSILSMKLLWEAFGVMNYTGVGGFYYGDDRPLSDSTVNLPTVWTHHNRSSENSFHHNSVGRVDFIDPERMSSFLAADAFYVIKSIAPTDEDVEMLIENAVAEANSLLLSLVNACEKDPEPTSRMKYYYEIQKKHLLDFKKYVSEERAEEIVSRLVCPKTSPDGEVSLTPWQKYAEKIRVKRVTRGLVHDLAVFKKEERRELPGLALYSPFANALANVDPSRPLYDFIKEALWETETPSSDEIYKKYVNTIHYLAEGGYLAVEDEGEISKENVKKCLQNLGINAGDTVMLHSSVSACGHIVGGTKTIIDSFLEVIGEEGTLMAPAFTRPYMYFEGAYQRAKNFRPHSKKNIKGISTGTVPKVMLSEYGAKRSAHASHSWCAIGKNADLVTREHALLDSPCGERNPMEKALALGGKVVFFGCGVSSNTFIHYLEDRANSNFLENAVIKILRDDGKLVTEVMKNHLPGCRDFYNFKKPECKFYKRAIERGLDIKNEALGVGSVYAMKLSELYEIGSELFREDPDVTLCDSPSCRFCRKYRHTKI